MGTWIEGLYRIMFIVVIVLIQSIKYNSPHMILNGRYTREKTRLCSEVLISDWGNYCVKTQRRNGRRADDSCSLWLVFRGLY